MTTDQKPAEFDPRVGFAAERTLLAWIRTGLALMGFGFVVARFGLFLREIAAAQQATPPHHIGMSLWVGTGLIILGIIVIGYAAVQHIAIMRSFARHEVWKPTVSVPGLALTVVLVLVGMILTAYLVISQS